ncbi:MAG TPA: hypothetical protein VGV35_19445 [Bryobacteraceae bacterium]|nr:hypothetical protein [Bryobacteraceae bacterium]
MRQTILFLFIAFIAGAQDIPIRLGDLINLIPPATNVDGRAIPFAAAVAPDGTAQKGTNLYLYMPGPLGASTRPLTNYTGAINLTGVTSLTYANTPGLIAFTALPSGPGGPEEVHLIDSAGLLDRTLVTDKQGCIQPLCPNCFLACVGPVHLNADASKVLYSVARQQPFYVVNANGSGLTQLPVFQGSLAPSPQRVISNTGQFVFTSSAPSGPTFAASATDVYILNLDGTGLRQLTKFGSNPNIFAANATISADGSEIAFESNFSNGGVAARQILGVRSDGTGLRGFSFGSDDASNPSISADGSVVTFIQSGQIKWSSGIGDPAVFTITNLSISTPHDAVVSDDGSQVVFTVGPSFGNAAAVYRTPTGLPSTFRNLTSIYAPRFVSANGVATAAGHGVPSPGSLISVYGFNLATNELTTASVFPLPTSLDSLSLLVNGQPVPLLATTPWQINAQLPQTLPTGQATFQVSYTSGMTLPSVTADITSISPEDFTFAFTRGNLGYQQAAALHAGTAVVTDLDHPASAGETIEIYGLGLGLTDPSVDAGVPSPNSPPARARQMPHLQIGGRDAMIVFAGLAPGLAGVYQVNAIVPSGLASGIQNLTWSGAGVTYSAIAVK